MVDLQSELLEKLEHLKDPEQVNPLLFVKLLTGFFSMSYYIKDDKSSYVYDYKMVAKHLENMDVMEIFDNTACTTAMLKTFFKVSDKKDPSKMLDLPVVIAELYESIYTTNIALQSMKSILAIRPFSIMESSKYDNLLKKLEENLSSRNHIISALDNFINYNDYQMLEDTDIIAPGTIDDIRKVQKFLTIIFKWQLPF